MRTVLADVQYLERWLREGFAIVATDYQGLGVPGGHPLLNASVAAYGILDAARAVVKSVPGLANKVLIIGQSQGGAGAFSAGAYAATYAPDLGVKGSIGTGVYTVGTSSVDTKVIAGNNELRSAWTMITLRSPALFAHSFRRGLRACYCGYSAR